MDELELFLLRFDVYRESEEGFQLLKDAQLFPLTGEVPVHSAGQLAILCNSIQTQWQNAEGFAHFQSQHIFLELLQHLFKNQSFFVKDSRTGLELAKAFLEEHYAENLSIEQLARIAQVSPKYFVDLYKKTYRISAMDYVGELRLNKAKQLMAKSNTKLRDIAHQVGYHDEFYFSRKFKKEVGVSPTVYMKNRQRKIAAYHAPIIGQMLALKMIPYAAPLHPKCNRSMREVFYGDLQMKPAFLPDRTEYDMEITLHQIALLDPDRLLLLVCQEVETLPDFFGEYVQALYR